MALAVRNLLISLIVFNQRPLSFSSIGAYPIARPSRDHQLTLEMTERVGSRRSAEALLHPASYLAANTKK